MGFIGAYSKGLVGSRVGQGLLGIPTVIGIIAAVFVSNNPWMWIAFILLGLVLAQAYWAYEKWWSPLQAAIRAVRLELKYLRKRLGEELKPGELTLPATAWNEQREVLQKHLDAGVFHSLWDFFDDLDRCNRNKDDPAGLKDGLERADAALAELQS